MTDEPRPETRAETIAANRAAAPPGYEQQRIDAQRAEMQARLDREQALRDRPLSPVKVFIGGVLAIGIALGATALAAADDGGSTYTPPSSSTSSYAECVAAGLKLDQTLSDQGYVIVDPAQHTRAMQEIRDMCAADQ